MKVQVGTTGIVRFDLYRCLTMVYIVIQFVQKG